jgi:thioredoxin-like negative regulator of GroEL
VRLAPDASEAHFRLATVALLRGGTNEAATALADCADHAAPYDRADFLRRLDLLGSEHPEVEGTVGELGTLLQP